MKSRPFGIMIIVVGILMLIYTGFTFSTTEKVVNLGEIEINRSIKHPVRWSPIIAVVLVSGGIVILVTEKKS